MIKCRWTETRRGMALWNGDAESRCRCLSLETTSSPDFRAPPARKSLADSATWRFNLLPPPQYPGRGSAAAPVYKSSVKPGVPARLVFLGTDPGGSRICAVRQPVPWISSTHRTAQRRLKIGHDRACPSEWACQARGARCRIWRRRVTRSVSGLSLISLVSNFLI